MISYDADVILWSKQQARLLRAGRFAELDIVHLADEIEDVGKSEKREFVSRMGVLLAHLLKWSRQPTKRSPSWRSTIVDQRKRVALAIRGTPSLRAVMRDPDWREDIWLDARAQARKETGLGEDELPASLSLDDGSGDRSGLLAGVRREGVRRSGWTAGLLFV